MFLFAGLKTILDIYYNVLSFFFFFFFAVRSFDQCQNTGVRASESVVKRSNLVKDCTFSRRHDRVNK